MVVRGFTDLGPKTSRKNTLEYQMKLCEMCRNSRVERIKNGSALVFCIVSSPSNDGLRQPNEGGI